MRRQGNGGGAVPRPRGLHEHLGPLTASRPPLPINTRGLALLPVRQNVRRALTG